MEERGESSIAPLFQSGAIISMDLGEDHSENLKVLTQAIYMYGDFLQL